MPRVPVHFGPQSDGAKSMQMGSTALVNCHVEMTSGGKAPFHINTDPGLALVSSIAPNQIGRGIAVLGNNLYAVVGEAIYKVSSGGAATYLGIVTGSEPVTFAINRKVPNNQITICADTSCYYIENDVLTKITNPNLPAGVHSVAYLHGRTIYGINDGRYFISQINDTANINALDFAEAERDSDPGIRVFANGGEFWYFGSRSLEIFRDTAATFPFAPMQGAGSGKGSGCNAKNSVALLDNSAFWVSDENRVVQARGYSPHRVSNHLVERDIESAFNQGLGNQIFGFTWSKGGHLFYHLSCALWTWVFDAASHLWHKKESYLQPNWRGKFYVYAFNKHLVLGDTDGLLYEYTDTARDENSSPLITRMVSQPLAYPMTRLTRGLVFPSQMICASLYLDIQAGVGRANTANHILDPVLILRISTDGGATWSSERTANMGQQAQWGRQIKFNRLGESRDAGMVFELRSPEPVERCMVFAIADVIGFK